MSASPQRSLFHKYLLVMFIAVLVPLMANGMSEAWFGHRDRRALVDALLVSEASSAAVRIQSFLDDLIAQLRWTTHMPMGGDAGERWLLDAHRLLRHVPAITEVSHLDATGRERVRVSRLALDVLASGVDRSLEPAFSEALRLGVYIGPVYLRNNAEPYVTLAVPATRRSAGVVVAEVNLKLTWDVVAGIRIGDAGLAYVIDGRGHLIAHPDISRVLRDADRANTREAGIPLPVLAKTHQPLRIEKSDGTSYVVAMAPVEQAGWMVVVEQPSLEAFAPIYKALARTGVLLTAGAALAAVLAFLLAQRMSGPIRRLEEGAAQIGAGNFMHRIDLVTRDELGRLAGRFNEMARELAVSQDRAQRIARLRQFLAPQVADLVESVGHEEVLDSQRVDVVAIFCDLRNFTAFSAQAKPDEVMAVLDKYYYSLGPIITKFEATQTSFTGDGLMLLLNAPLPRDNPAALAAAMATEMQVVVQALVVEWRSRGFEIGYGMGMAEGPATVGRIGYQGRLEYTAIGSVVNLASRLCAAAADGEVLVNRTLADNLGAAARLSNLGFRSLKGFDAEIEVFSLTWQRLGAETQEPKSREGAA